MVFLGHASKFEIYSGIMKRVKNIAAVVVSNDQTIFASKVIMLKDNILKSRKYIYILFHFVQRHLSVPANTQTSIILKFLCNLHQSEISALIYQCNLFLSLLLFAFLSFFVL